MAVLPFNIGDRLPYIGFVAYRVSALQTITHRNYSINIFERELLFTGDPVK
jgi:hypothetical protein